MRTLLAPLLVLVACGHPPQLLPETLDLPRYCEAKAKLVAPPHGDKTIAQVIAFARSAARTANTAMAERDACAMNYAQLRAACSTSAGCIIPPPPR
jgi:hypothetical protein